VLLSGGGERERNRDRERQRHRVRDYTQYAHAHSLSLSHAHTRSPAHSAGCAPRWSWSTYVSRHHTYMSHHHIYVTSSHKRVTSSHIYVTSSHICHIIAHTHTHQLIVVVVRHDGLGPQAHHVVDHLHCLHIFFGLREGFSLVQYSVVVRGSCVAKKHSSCS